MPSSSLRRGWIVPLCCAVVLVPLAIASKSFVQPETKPAVNYPAHDAHSDEKVAIAADPYDTPEKAKIFSVDFAAHGFLPVFFLVTNDGDQPIALANMEITMITGNRAKLTPIGAEDLYRRLSNPQAHTAPSPLPIPLPHKKPLSEKAMEEIELAHFAARAVEPHTTQSGFLFFDVGGIAAPLKGASVEVTGVDDAKGTELLYFEITMDKYLNRPANP